MGGEKKQKREGPQSPVGRGRWGGALLQAGFEPAIYAVTDNVGYHYATLPPLPFSPVHSRNNRYHPMFSLSFSLALLPLRSTLSLSRSRMKGFSGCAVGLYPPRGSNPPPQDSRGVVYPLSYDELLPSFWSRNSVHQRCIASCVALAPLGAKHQQLGQERLVCIYWGPIP